MYKIKKFLSCLPLFSFTDDDKFGELTKECKKHRFSLFRFSFGVYKLYFFTFRRGDGFKFCRRIWLYDILETKTDKESKQKAVEYAVLIGDETDEKSKVHIKALQHKMSQLENTMVVSWNKLVFYNTVLFMFSGVLIAWILQTTSLTISFIQLVIAYFLVNIWLFSWEFIKIGGWSRFAFGELKRSSVPIKKLAESIYYEWYYTRYRVPLYVSFVKNIEKYFLYIVVILGILSMGLFGWKIKYFFDAEKPRQPMILIEAMPKLTVDLPISVKDILNDTNISTLREIQDGLSGGEYSQIILMRSKKKIEGYLMMES